MKKSYKKIFLEYKTMIKAPQTYFPVQTTPEEFENGDFTLKTH